MKNEIFKISANIFLIDGSRSTPIKTGYRPGFIFNDSKQTSGSIRLIGLEQLDLGEKATVKVWFSSDELLKKCKKGDSFSFYEGSNKIGRGEILEILGWRTAEDRK